MFQANRIGSILSVVLRHDYCEWVLVKAWKDDVIHCKDILAGGQVPSNQLLFAEDGALTEMGLKALIGAILERVERKHKTPKELVVTVPSMNSFQMELAVPGAYAEGDILYEVEGKLNELLGEQHEGIVCDWKDRFELYTGQGERPLVVATLKQDQVDLIESVAAGYSMRCLAITLDSVASANGYVNALTRSNLLSDQKFFLLGSLSPRQVKLSVFDDGMLSSENSTDQDEDFSMVQAISALERLLLTWAQQGVGTGTKDAVLVLTGPMAHHESAQVAASRSTQLKRYLLELPAASEDGQDMRWVKSVTAYGALEGMPCA